ncbi:NAD-dependent epimerase/dehydratase family protein [Dactylosporangium roseum]
MRPGMAAVIGATGFLGSRLVTELSAAGRPMALFNRARPPVVGGRPAGELGAAETVFFLAAGLNPMLAARSPAHVAEEHSLLAEVLRALTRTSHRPLVVLASSGGAVYSPRAVPPYRESSPVDPSSAYGHAKLRLERLLFAHSGAIRPLVLRLGNVYGPGQHPRRGYGVLAHWLTAVARGEPVRVFGDPSVARDYVHVDDVTRLLAIVHSTVASGLQANLPTVLNVGSGRPTSLAHLLTILREATDRDLTVLQEDSRPFDRQSNWLDPTLAQRTLGWSARIELRDGVRRLLELPVDLLSAPYAPREVS